MEQVRRSIKCCLRMIPNSRGLMRRILLVFQVISLPTRGDQLHGWMWSCVRMICICWNVFNHLPVARSRQLAALNSDASGLCGLFMRQSSGVEKNYGARVHWAQPPAAPECAFIACAVGVSRSATRPLAPRHESGRSAAEFRVSGLDEPRATALGFGRRQEAPDSPHVQAGGDCTWWCGGGIWGRSGDLTG